MTPKMAMKKAMDIVNSGNDHPYYNANHPNHKAAVEEVRELFQAANPDESQQ